MCNHGGHQLEGALATVLALPAIAADVEGTLAIFADSGIRSGFDVMRMIAFGADAMMIGRPFVCPLATGGRAGVRNLHALFQEEMRVAMALKLLLASQSLRFVSADPVPDAGHALGQAVVTIEPLSIGSLVWDRGSSSALPAVRRRVGKSARDGQGMASRPFGPSC